ncbi:MAG: transposase [Deltaproteobacteria bacterium]|jgi:putative transposase|nr:transposase [Deltaproteobacteria bacterium]
MLLQKHQSRDILKQHFGKEHTFSSDGYFAASVGQAGIDMIEYYIRNQGRQG